MKRILSQLLAVCLVFSLASMSHAETLEDSPMEIAFLKGTWYEMGYQFGQQYPDNLRKGVAFSKANMMRSWGNYENAVAAIEPYLEVCKTVFAHPDDGGYADMIQGAADATGIDYYDAAMYFLGFVVTSDIPFGVPEGEEEAYYASLGEETDKCSFSAVWGNANAAGDLPILACNNDAGYDPMEYMPTLLLKPNNGYLTMVAMGIFGCTCNAEGLTFFGASGGVHGVDRIGLDPYLFANSYCKTVEEALDLLGRPEDPMENWWPIGCCVNTVMADATGRVVVFEFSSVKRALREIGDKKYIGKTSLGEITIADETADYLVGNNFFFTENMFEDCVTNIEAGLGFWWDDCLPRYWTVEKYIQDAVAEGGADIDTLREAQGSHSYYIPEGWDFDAYPDWGYLGYWVPSEIYEGFADGSVNRADYYGEAYDPELWGEPLSLEESRSCTWWCPGWHDNLNQWSLYMGMNLWAPEPQTANFKTTYHFMYDTNSNIAYFMKGSSYRFIADIPNTTGTYVPFFLSATTDSEDPFMDMTNAAEKNLKDQIWLAAKNLTESGIDIDTADGQVLYGYLETARESMFDLMAYSRLGTSATDENERLLQFARAYTSYAKGVSYAQLAQANPQSIIKDFGVLSPFEG